ncbi:MAG: hypothetical protein ABFS56_21075 [Pseudomonadota bacterium]
MKVSLEFNALDELAEKWKNHEFTLSFFEAKRRASMGKFGFQYLSLKDLILTIY